METKRKPRSDFTDIDPDYKSKWPLWVAAVSFGVAIIGLVVLYFL